MIRVVIPLDKNFDYKACEKMFKKCQKWIGDYEKFEDIVNGTFFYSFYKDDELLGCIYCFFREDKLFLNGFAGRHHHKENMECMRMVLSWFNCDIYAESIRKTAIFCLYELGFKKVSRNIYKYER